MNKPLKNKHLKKYLKKKDVQFVRLLWCDNANVIRAKAFHRQFLAEHQDVGIGISAGQQGVPVLSDVVLPDSGVSPIGEVWLVPDWNTLNALPYAIGHARVMGDLVQDGKPWALCPRGFLKRMIAEAASEGIEMMAAFENEFYLLQPDLPLVSDPSDRLQPVDRSLFASTQSMDLNHALINDIAAALNAQDIPVERYHPEAGGGQQEIVVRYTHALAAADRQIALRETVRGVALQHQVRASFLPKIFADQSGSGCHLHLSLWRMGQNLLLNPDAPGELSAIARSFIAGILHHLPALMALTTPSPNSYRRLQPHSWSGAYRCWGYDNREAAIRIPTNPFPPSPTHFEVKTIDATANPYLALGAIIAAGLDGFRQQMPLTDPIQSDPGYLSEEERHQRLIDRLPENLGSAIAHLSQNDLLLTALSPVLAQAFLAVRTAEWQAMKELSLDAEVNLLVDRY